MAWRWRVCSVGEPEANDAVPGCGRLTQLGQAPLNARYASCIETRSPNRASASSPHVNIMAGNQRLRGLPARKYSWSRWKTTY